MSLKRPPEVLGDSLQAAKLRFLSLERKFQREPRFRNKYMKFMKEYLELHHMSESLGDVVLKNKTYYYLPHHGVFQESSTTTKLRVVSDASASTTSGISLNDLQMVGPTVQDDLFAIL
ncbi:hypothetical protein EVAR_10678_1 [Eumeta japonica]|uniref:Uncharacterized protein n=1 Tax=Eumeta variegata TaxID=151549 RepID=A0A4C1U7B0_EUMVA|nr:hypothetical protein EVAR_10678_1 [Eumeta japonica]